MTQEGRAPGAAPVATPRRAPGSGPRTVSGRLDGRGLKIGIVAARFNEEVAERLLEGALVELTRLGVRSEDLTVARVPGAFELPLAALYLAHGGMDAVVCLGAVIRGETPHFDYVAGACAGGIARVAEATGVPVLFGVLTTDTTAQALDRAGGRYGNKGAEAAAAAVEMVQLVRQLGTGRNP